MSDLEVVVARVQQVPNFLIVHLNEGAFGAVSAYTVGFWREKEGQWKATTYSTLSSVLELILSNIYVQARGTTPHSCTTIN